MLQTDIKEIAFGIESISEKLAGKTILITGGRGFLGRYFIETFNFLNKNILEKPVKTIALDNLITSGTAGSEFPSYENVEFINHNVIHPFKTNQKLDFIIHAAGIASPFYYRAYPLETLEVAINGTRNMLELAKKHKSRFSFFSSSEIYGDPDSKNVPIQESYKGNVSCQGPRACYDESKRVGETLCYIYHSLEGIKTNVIRPFNVFGPGMQENDYRVLPNFASQIKKGKSLKIYGTGNQTRTFCYITDAIEGFLRVITNGIPGESYNIGNVSPEISIMNLVEVITKISEKPINYDVIDYPDSYPSDEPNRRAPDIRKATTQLGYIPKVSLNEGLERFLQWTDSNYSSN